MFTIKALSTMLVFNGVQCTEVPVVFEVSLPIFTGLTLSIKLVFLFSFVAILFCGAALHWSRASVSLVLFLQVRRVTDISQQPPTSRREKLPVSFLL